MIVAKLFCLTLGVVSVSFSPAPVVKSEIGGKNSFASFEADNGDHLPRHTHNESRVIECSENESENETEGSEKFEKEIELWTRVNFDKKALQLSYGIRTLEHISQFTQDGFSSKLYKPPATT